MAARNLMPFDHRPLINLISKILNPLTAGVVHIRFLHFILAHHYISAFKPVKIKSDINQQDLKFIGFHFVKSEYFSPTCGCGSRQRDTTSSEWKFKLNNLAAKGLMQSGSWNAITIFQWLSKLYRVSVLLDPYYRTSYDIS